MSKLAREMKQDFLIFHKAIIQQRLNKIKFIRYTTLYLNEGFEERDEMKEKMAIVKKITFGGGLLAFLASCFIPSYSAFKGGNSHIEQALPQNYSFTGTEMIYPVAMKLNGYSTGSPCTFNPALGGGSDSVLGYFLPASHGGADCIVIPFYYKAESKPCGVVKLSSISLKYEDRKTSYKGGVYSPSAPTVVVASDQFLSKNTVTTAAAFGSMIYYQGSYLNTGMAPQESGFFVIGISSVGVTKIKRAVSHPPITNQTQLEQQVALGAFSGEEYTATVLILSATLTLGTKEYLQPACEVKAVNVNRPEEGTLQFTLENFNQKVTCELFSKKGENWNALFIYSKEGDRIIPKYFTFVDINSDDFAGKIPQFTNENPITLTVKNIPEKQMNATHCQLYPHFKDIFPDRKQ